MSTAVATSDVTSVLKTPVRIDEKAKAVALGHIDLTRLAPALREVVCDDMAVSDIHITPSGFSYLTAGMTPWWVLMLVLHLGLLTNDRHRYTSKEIAKITGRPEEAVIYAVGRALRHFLREYRQSVHD